MQIEIDQNFGHPKLMLAISKTLWLENIVSKETRQALPGGFFGFYSPTNTGMIAPENTCHASKVLATKLKVM